MRLTFSAQQRIEQLTQRATASENSRLHSAYRYFEDSATSSYDSPQGRAESLRYERVWHRLQRAPYRQLCLVSRELLERRGIQIFELKR